MHKNIIDMGENQVVRPVCYLSDVELPFEDELNNLEDQLSLEEEEILKEIVEAESNIEKKDIVNDLLEAVKKGAEDYLDAMTDTGETFEHLKNSSKVNKLDCESITRKQTPVTIEEQERIKPRTMSEANKNPFDNDSVHSTVGMSRDGAAKFSMHVEAYKQRTKSMKDLSTDGHIIHYKTDGNANLESLSGLRGYRVGIVVPMDSASEVQEAFNTDSQSTVIDSKSKWLRDRNFDKFDEALVKEYGFKTKADARAWRKSNHLTIHESADGMILVPTDVHDRASHSGYCSQMVKLLNGEISKEQFDKSVVQEKTAYVKHEAMQHSIRAAKGIGMAVVKDMLKFSIATICKETYNEFKQTSEEKFVQRMMRILNGCWQKFKIKFSHEIKSLLSGGLRGILNELLTMLNDYFLGVFKKIFKIVRQMWGSIKNAFKIICSKKYSWQERVFEASKILSAGIVGILGFSLNEIIEKLLMSIGIPFASFIAECLSGLFAGIMSAIVLMIFDNLKAYYKTKSASLLALCQQSNLNRIYMLRISIDSMRADLEMLSAYEFFGMTFKLINETREHLLTQMRDSHELTLELYDQYILMHQRQLAIKAIKNEVLNDQLF